MTTAGKRILLIEGDEGLESLLTAIFSRAGYAVEAVPPGAAAVASLDLLENDGFAAVVIQFTPYPSPVDASVPTGIGLLRLLRDRAPHWLARTFVLTTSMPSILNEFRDTCTIVQEPFDIDDLVEAIRRI